MRYRVVLYQAARWAADGELLEALGGAAGIDRDAVAARLAAPGPAVFEDLEESSAAGLVELLGARGGDADLEPMTPEAGRIEWLAAEVPKWVKRGIIHPASVPRLYRNYGMEPPPTAAPAAAEPAKPKGVATGTLLRAVLTLGTVLIGLGLILFIAANWQRIPLPAKIGGAMALTLAALHAAYRLRFVRRTAPRIAAVFFSLSLFGIGGVVIIIGQAYHVQAESYLLPLVWGALCVPVALLLRFKPALYAASGLWLWSYWLYAGSHDTLLWLYPVLLLGFLIPYALAIEDRKLYRVHLAVLMLALISTLATQDFWLCSVWVAALVLLRLRFREILYDWLLVVGFLFWHLVFLTRYGEIPNGFYAVPLAYFFYRAWRERSNALMAATVLNASFWIATLFLQIIARWDLPEPTQTAFLLWAMALGVLWFGLGKQVEPSDAWSELSRFLRLGGAAIAGFAIYVLSFRFYADEQVFFRSPLVLGSSLAFGAAGLLLAAPVLARESDRSKQPWGALLLVALAVLGLVLCAAAPPASGLQVALFNLILFIGAMMLMLCGYRAQSFGWFNGGIGLFVLLIVSRYFDTFVAYLPRSVFFVLGGVFLIAWAVVVDRQRKRRASEQEGTGA